MRKTYEEKFESAFAGALAETVGEPSDDFLAFAGRVAGLIQGRSKHRGIPGERAGKLAADICRPLYKMRIPA